MDAEMSPAAPADRYFVSYSHHDAAFAHAIRDGLSAQAWVDLYELDVGQLLLEEIASAIELATDFVLLWSTHSAESPWVRFELHMAFIRYLDDRAIRLRIVLLDDTAVPLYLRPFLQLRQPTDSSTAVEALEGRPPREAIRKRFIDRNDEIGAIEAALHSPVVGAIWLWGLPGVGKRSLVREGLARIIGSGAQYRTLGLRTGIREAELNLLVTGSLGIPSDPETLSRDEVVEKLESRLAEYTDALGVWVFQESQHWLQDDGLPNETLRTVLSATSVATPAAGRLVIFTSSRQVRLTEPWLRRVHLSGLDPDFGAALLSLEGATDSLETLRQISSELDGHPLALRLASSSGELTMQQAGSHRVRVAHEIVGALPLTETTIQLLEVVAAVDGPMPSSQIAEHLSLTHGEFIEAANQAAEHALLVQNDAHVSTHPLLRDFFIRSFRRHETADQRLANLANRAHDHLRTLDSRQPEYLYAMSSTMRLYGLSGDFSTALSLRSDLSGVLFETGLELYRSRRYAEARRYFEEATARYVGDLDSQLYLCRCLAYLDQLEEARALVTELLEQYTGSAYVMRVAGRIEYIAKNFSQAIAWYRQALAAGARRALMLNDIAQALNRANRWEEAIEWIESEPGVIDRLDPYGLNEYSIALEHVGRLEESRGVMQRAVSQDSRNAAFRHRLGRIAEQTGDLHTAKREYLSCLAIDSEYREAIVSAASVLGELGEFTEARRLLSRARQVHLPTGIVENLSAKLAMLEGDLDEARRLIMAALDKSRDVHNLDLAIRILISTLEVNGSLGDGAQSECHLIELLLGELQAKGAGDQAYALRVRAAAQCPGL